MRGLAWYSNHGYLTSKMNRFIEYQHQTRLLHYHYQSWQQYHCIIMWKYKQEHKHCPSHTIPNSSLTWGTTASFYQWYSFSLTPGFLASRKKLWRFPIIELLLLTDNMQSKAKPLNLPSNHLTQTQAVLTMEAINYRPFLPSLSSSSGVYLS